MLSLFWHKAGRSLSGWSSFHRMPPILTQMSEYGSISSMSSCVICVVMT